MGLGKNRAARWEKHKETPGQRDLRAAGSRTRKSTPGKRSSYQPKQDMQVGMAERKAVQKARLRTQGGEMAPRRRRWQRFEPDYGEWRENRRCFSPSASGTCNPGGEVRGNPIPK